MKKGKLTDVMVDSTVDMNIIRDMYFGLRKGKGGTHVK